MYVYYQNDLNNIEISKVPKNCVYRDVNKAIVTLLERITQKNPTKHWLK